MCVYICVFLHVALPVKTGIILLWGEALRPPPNPPRPLLYSSHTCNTLLCMCKYIYIYMFLHVALPVKTGIVILLCPPPAFIFNPHLQYTSLYVYVYIYTFFALSLCFGGRRCALPPIPPPASLFNSHLHHTSLHVCIYMCVFFACSIACENGYHSALGGGAAPSPQSPLPLLYSSHTCNTLLCMCKYIYIYVFACSIACENRYCHSALPPSRFYIQVTLAMHFSACVYIYIRFLRCHSALGGGAAPSPQSPLPLLYSSHTCITTPCVCIYIYLCLCVCFCMHIALPVKTGIVILLWGEALCPCFCFDLIPMRVHA